VDQILGSRSKAAGYGTVIPAGFTWHHNENLGLMQLVEKDVHLAVAHTGGFAIFKSLMEQLGKKFNLVDYSK
jgi:A nuclease of the HNH/ENDO VII superfamily with conserved WHH